MSRQAINDRPIPQAHPPIPKMDKSQKDVSVMSDHKRFSVEQGCIAGTSDWFIRFTPEEIVNADGTRTIGLSFPAIAATDWLDNPEATLNGVAAALNEDDAKDTLITELVGALDDALDDLNTDIRWADDSQLEGLIERRTKLEAVLDKAKGSEK